MATAIFHGSNGHATEYSTGKNEGPIFSASKIMMVHPARENRAPVELYKVSNLDQTVPYFVEVIFVFQTESYNVNVGEVLKHSLEIVLEKYYPLAGKLRLGFDGKMVVECGGGECGVPFAEAFSDKVATAVVGDISGIDEKVVKKLFYSSHRPYETILDVPPLAVQVTRFKCGNVILGVRFNHVFFDGIGFLDFMTSWSETARGLPLSIEPCIDRSILFARKYPKAELLHREYSRIERPLTLPLTGGKTTITKSFRLTPATISRLRNSGDAMKPAPTTFEIASALVWSCWTKAKKLSPEDNIQIAIAVDGRRRLQQPPPQGYFGNCIVSACAKSTVGEITSQPLSYVAAMVQNAINEVDDDYVRSVIDFHEITGRPLELENTMWITKWSRLPFYEIDFGWGGASKVGPGATWESLVVYFCEERACKNRVVSLSLPIEAMEIFQELVESELDHK